MSQLSTLRRLVRGLARRARAEDGISLVMAIGIMTVLTISTAGVITFSTANQTAAGRDRQSLRAFGAAEAGLDAGANAIAVADPSGTAAPSASVGPSPISIDGSTGTWSASKVGPSRWVVTATVGAPGGQTVRTLQRVIDGTVVTGQKTISPVYGYGFFMADKTADCTVISGTGDTISNSAQVSVPVYIASSLCLSGGGSPLIAEPGSGHSTIPLYVGGKLTTTGNSDPVGTPSQHLQSATIVGGCQIYFHGWKNVICSQQGVPTDGTGSGVWADSYSSTPQNLTKPTIDPDAAYQNAAPGPKHPCTTRSGVTVPFDSAGSTVRDDSKGTIRLLYLSGSWGAANNFDCTVKDAQGNVTGRIAWTFGQPGTLTIQGTVFLDGDLVLQGTDMAVYNGTGILYVDGTVDFSNGARLCGATMAGSKCSGNWDPSSGNSLMIVAVNQKGLNPAWNMEGDGEFEGSAYVVGRYVSGNSAWVQGPVIADSGQLSGDTKFKQIVNPPTGWPGVTTLQPSVTWHSTQWRECPSAGTCPAVPSS